MVLISQDGFVHAVEAGTFTGLAVSFLGQVINTKYHILRRNGHRTAVRRLEQVVGRQQQESAFRLGLHGKGQMDGHLVTVKVGVESGTYQRMQLDRFTFDQDGLESLDAQSVQGRRAVEHYRVFFDDILQDIPYSAVYFLDQLFGVLDIHGDASVMQLLHHERLEQFEGHFLGHTALIDLELGADDNNGTSGIVDSLTQQVLSETAVLTLEHI